MLWLSVGIGGEPFESGADVGCFVMALRWFDVDAAIVAGCEAAIDKGTTMARKVHVRKKNYIDDGGDEINHNNAHTHSDGLTPSIVLVGRMSCSLCVYVCMDVSVVYLRRWLRGGALRRRIEDGFGRAQGIRMHAKSEVYVLCA